MILFNLGQRVGGERQIRLAQEQRLSGANSGDAVRRPVFHSSTPGKSILVLLQDLIKITHHRI